MSGMLFYPRNELTYMWACNASIAAGAVAGYTSHEPHVSIVKQTSGVVACLAELCLIENLLFSHLQNNHGNCQNQDRHFQEIYVIFASLVFNFLTTAILANRIAKYNGGGENMREFANNRYTPG